MNRNTPEEMMQFLQDHLALNARWTEAAGFPCAGTFTGFGEFVANFFNHPGADRDGFRFTAVDYFTSDSSVITYMSAHRDLFGLDLLSEISKFYKIVEVFAGTTIHSGLSHSGFFKRAADLHEKAR